MGIDGWKKQLTTDQVKKILHIVHGFGINFYSENIEPDYEILYYSNLTESIHLSGS